MQRSAGGEIISLSGRFVVFSVGLFHGGERDLQQVQDLGVDGPAVLGRLRHKAFMEVVGKPQSETNHDVIMTS